MGLISQRTTPERLFGRVSVPESFPASAYTKIPTSEIHIGEMLQWERFNREVPARFPFPSAPTRKTRRHFAQGTYHLWQS